MNIDIEQRWEDELKDTFTCERFGTLVKTIKKSYMNKKTCTYPPSQNIFNSFNKTPFNEIRVVILGQDPYHNTGQAHGLCFSVPSDIPAPPSLKNIFKELEIDTGIKRMQTNLTDWAEQGVFLLNSTLTVEENNPNIHAKIWEWFTDEVIHNISQKRENVVFMLWGNFARSKKHLINEKKHFILETTHPSPFSAHKGFFGCKHFSKTNKFLRTNNYNIIKW